MRSPPGAGSCELMISFTLPIAFSVICTMLLFAPEISGLPWSPLYRRNWITPTVNHLDGAGRSLVAENSTLNSAAAQEPARRRPHPPGRVLSCKEDPLKPGRGYMRQ